MTEITIQQINELIRFALTNTKITSAGGDSPKINTVIAIESVQSPAFPDEGINIAGGDTAGIGTPSAIGGFKPTDVTLALSASRGANLSGVIGRFGGSLGPAAIIAVIPQLVPIIAEELTRPGGLLDKRVRIDAREEAFAEIDRQTRQNTRIGDRQVIIQQVQGFRADNGFLSTNTSDLIRDNADRVLDIGLFDRAQGLSQGGK